MTLPGESKSVPASMTLDELRAAIIDEARSWLAWGHGLDDFLDGGPIPSACLAHGVTGPGRPSIDLNRQRAGGHRTRILGRPDGGEVVLTWAEIRRELRRGRDGEQMELVGVA